MQFPERILYARAVNSGQVYICCGKKLSLLVAFMLPISCAAAAPPCNFAEEPSTKQTSVSIPLENLSVPTTTKHFIAIEPIAQGETVNILVRSSVDLSQLSTAVPQIVAQRVQIPASSCNDRYSSGGTHFGGTGGNELTGGFDVHYSRWQCISADVPCPTWRNPTRFCRKEATTKLAEATVHVKFSMVAAAQNGRIVVTTSSNASAPDISGPLAFVGGIAGGIVLGPVGSIVGALTSDKFGRDIEDRIKSVGRTFTSTEIPDQAQLEELKELQLQLVDADFKGTSPITLEIIHKSRELRANSACFLKAKLISNGI